MKERKWHITTIISSKAKKNVDAYQKKFKEVNKSKITKMEALNLILENYN